MKDLKEEIKKLCDELGFILVIVIDEEDLDRDDEYNIYYKKYQDKPDFKGIDIDAWHWLKGVKWCKENLVGGKK